MYTFTLKVSHNFVNYTSIKLKKSKTGIKRKIGIVKEFYASGKTLHMFFLIVKKKKGISQMLNNMRRDKLRHIQTPRY